MIIFFLPLILYFLSIPFLPVLFEKAGIEDARKKALIPFSNLNIWSDLIGRPRWRWLMLFVPILNIFVFVGLCVHLVRSFERFSFMDTFLATVFPPLAFFLTGRDPKAKYHGKIFQLQQEYLEKIEDARRNKQEAKYRKLVKNNPYHKTPMREWTEALVFAVFAASFIRMFVIEPYIIPTSSMEGSMLVGDFLFVSKLSYGVKTPQTIAALPLLHNRIPLLNKESYWEKPQLKYRRLPKIRSIKRFDPVVFHYPEGDSVIITPRRTFSVYDFERMGVPIPPQNKIITRPVDKMDNYVKRCIGLPGDVLEVRDREVYVNDERIKSPTHIKHTYRVGSKDNPVSRKRLDEIGVRLNDITDAPNNVYYNLDPQQVETIKSWGGDITVEFVDPQHRPNYLFPHNEEYFPNQTVDNCGPYRIPQKGLTVPLNDSTLSMYERVIDVYEGKDFQKKPDGYYIDGVKSDSYTFDYDYYWMMGDNRHNSEDSRVWGFVPETHILGKPLFTFMSLKNNRLSEGIRWNRIFRKAGKM